MDRRFAAKSSPTASRNCARSLSSRFDCEERPFSAEGSSTMNDVVDTACSKAELIVVVRIGQVVMVGP
jgi:hypothetical protein